MRNRWRVRRGQQPSDGVTPLAALRPGQSCQVISMSQQRAGALARLSAFGIVPGATIHLSQRHPAYVLKVHETEIAIDDSIARDIIVKPIGQ